MAFYRVKTKSSSITLLICSTSLLIIILMLRICYARFDKKNGCLRSIQQILCWNWYLRLFLEEYLLFAIAAFIKLFALDFTTKFERASSVFALLLTLLIVSAPFLIWSFLYKNHNRIRDKDFIEKYGTLTLELQLRER